MRISITKELIQSDIRDMSLECDKIKGINLSQGVCDLETPAEVVEGAKKAISKGFNYYTKYDGIVELQKAIGTKLRNFNGMRVDYEKQIVVSGGATGALFSAMLALLDAGDEVILFEPYYGYHLQTIEAVGAKPVYVRTKPPNEYTEGKEHRDTDWYIDMEELESKIAASTKVKAILINTPSNPSGKVFSKKELEQIAEICERHDLIVFTDEIYEYFVYDGLEHISPASLPKLKDRTVMVSGYSKTFSITGWRIGYCVCREEWAQRIGHISDLIYVCAPTPLQYGVAEGIATLPGRFYTDIGNEYKKKRDMICSTLEEIGLTPFVPKGAYYVLADAKKIPGKSSRERAMHLLRTTGVATVPGRAFYHDNSGEDLIRICFAKKDEELAEACKRLRSFERR